MKFKNIILLTGMLLPVGSVFAQYTEDALRFSQPDHGATSRFKALGSAQTALGGDISSIASNPAGLGLFTRSEFSFTPEFLNSTVNSQYLGTNSNVKKDKIGIQELGIVFYSPTKRFSNTDVKKGWLSTNFAFAYNKTNNFNTTVDYGGSNNLSSFADYLSNIADASASFGDPEVEDSALPQGSLERMAYNNYLIEYSPATTTTAAGYFPTTAVNPGNNNQRNLVFHAGSQSELNFGISTNYSNQLYLGATISIASINYGADREFTESGKTRSYSGQPAAFVNAGYNLLYRSSQETKGTGFNTKLGIIYRATPAVRVGASFISPTWYTLSDEFSEELETRYSPANGSYLAPYTNDEKSYPNEYSLRTPYRVNGGIAVTLSNLGLITGDVEYVDYASIKFNSEDTDVDNDMKRSIRDTYQSAVNYRVGIEAKVHPLVQLRVGYNIKGNPYQQSDYSSNTFTSGIGYRHNNLTFDLAFTTLATKYSPKPYELTEDYPDFNITGSGPVATIKNTTNNVFATIGLRF